MKQNTKVLIEEIKNNRLAIIMFTGLTLLITLQSRSSIFADGATAIDSSVFRYVAYAMHNGQTMYLDTFDHKGPLIYFINYLAMGISFKHGVWIVELVPIFVSLYMGYKLARLYVSKIASATTVLLIYSYLGVFYEGGNSVEEWALPFIAISMYLFTKYIKEGQLSFINIAINGFCCGAVILIKANMIAVWLVYILVIIFTLVKSGSDGFKELGRCICAFVFGVLAILIPTIVYLFAQGALAEFFNQYIIFNLQYQKSGLWGRYYTFLYYAKMPIVCISIFLFIFIGIRKKYNKHSKNFYINIVASFLAIFGSLIVICQSGRGYGHYTVILYPTLILPICLILEYIFESLHSEKVEKTIISLIIGFYCSVVILIPNWSMCIENIYGAFTDYDAYIEDMIQEYVVKLTQPDELISVVGTKDYVYLRSQRMSASKYSYQFPISSVDDRIFEEYLSDLAQNKPKVIFWANKNVKGYDTLFEKMNIFLEEYHYKLLEPLDYNYEIEEEEKCYVYLRQE